MIGAKGIYLYNTTVVKWAGVAVFSSPHLLVILSPPFIQDHDHCWKLGTVEPLCGERTMRTDHSGMSPSIITAGRIDIDVTVKPSTHPSYSDIVVRSP